MTKVFLKPLKLKSESEKFILEAFSKRNRDKIKKYDAIKRPKLKRIKERKLSVADLF